jgi:sulfate permease, SulP family
MAWPIFRSLANYRREFVVGDVIAGLTLVAIAIPEQMATARLGGFAPHVGFYAFIAGTIGFAVLGSNRFLSCGADSTITPIFAGGLALLTAAGSADYQVTAATLALAVGAILLVSGTLKFGWIANLLSAPVIAGFLAGIAVHILASQLPAVLGITAPTGSTLNRLAQIAQHLGETNRYALIIGLGVFVLIVVSESISAKIPGALIGLVGASLAVVLFGLEERGVAIIGSVPSELPHFVMPDVSLERWRAIVPLSLLIAIVVMVQTAATTQSFPSDPDHPPDVDRDFLGAGAGSVIASLIGAFPVNASPPRTSIVSETGGRSQISGLIAVTIVLAILGFGAALLAHVPEAALGGVLLFVATRIVRVKQMAAVLRQSPSEFLLIVATAAAIIVLPIEQGVAIGIVTSLLHGLWNTTRSHVIIYEQVAGTTVWWPHSPELHVQHNEAVMVVGFQAPLSFLNAARFRSELLGLVQSAMTKPKLIVIEATGILEIDFTAAQVLIDLIETCRRDGITVAVARLESVRAQEAFARFGINDRLGPHRVFLSVDQALKALATEASG